MSKVSLAIDVDPEVIRKFIEVIESHNVSLSFEVEKYFKRFFDEVILLFDQDDHIIQVRMK